MSESKPSVDQWQRLLLTAEEEEEEHMDMAAAAQQLMQLSDEDNYSSSSSNNDVDVENCNNKIMINSNQKSSSPSSKDSKRSLFEHISQDEITSATLEEIFGKEEEILNLRPTVKKHSRRYRFLESVYKETKPI